jgi:hypothetical protein
MVCYMTSTTILPANPQTVWPSSLWITNRFLWITNRLLLSYVIIIIIKSPEGRVVYPLSDLLISLDLPVLQLRKLINWQVNLCNNYAHFTSNHCHQTSHALDDGSFHTPEPPGDLEVRPFI